MDMPFLLVTYLSGWRRRDARIRSKTIAGQTLLACSTILIGGAIPLESGQGGRIVPFNVVLESGNETMLHLSVL